MTRSIDWEKVKSKDKVRKSRLFGENELYLDPLKFGKYRGKTIPEIPTDYLSWALNNLTDSRMLRTILVELIR